MANEEHVALLMQGDVDVWNAWRRQNPQICPDLSGAFLVRPAPTEAKGVYLVKANLSGANLSHVNLTKADLHRADLSEANLTRVILHGATLSSANLSRANLLGAKLIGAILIEADLPEANLLGADLSQANLNGVNLHGANLSEANLYGADLHKAVLREAKLSSANLSRTVLVEADFANADLTGCRIYGVSAWGLNLDGTTQSNLIITPHGEAEITVDSIEVGQFIYLLLHNAKIRDVIDTITSKAVLILGRFTPERKAVLDALREELRKRDYLPILFDFEKPITQNVTATVLTLARLSKFIIADLTDPSSIPFELGRIVPNTKVPVQPILLSSRREFAMFPDLQADYHWVLPIHYYEGQKQLIADIGERVIGPAEEWLRAQHQPKSGIRR
jgi:uncharacterized protein YjbI with pentapeptide repeats